jgi:hypothetical protein
MMIAMRGESASDALVENRNSETIRVRRTLLLRVAVHHRAGLQVLECFGKLHVGFGIK